MTRLMSNEVVQAACRVVQAKYNINPQHAFPCADYTPVQLWQIIETAIADIMRENARLREALEIYAKGWQGTKTAIEALSSEARDE